MLHTDYWIFNQNIVFEHTLEAILHSEYIAGIILALLHDAFTSKVYFWPWPSHTRKTLTHMLTVSIMINNNIPRTIITMPRVFCNGNVVHRPVNRTNLRNDLATRDNSSPLFGSAVNQKANIMLASQNHCVWLTNSKYNLTACLTTRPASSCHCPQINIETQAR